MVTNTKLFKLLWSYLFVKLCNTLLNRGLVQKGQVAKHQTMKKLYSPTTIYNNLGN